jgi:Helix-turn-helix domain
LPSKSRDSVPRKLSTTDVAQILGYKSDRSVRYLVDKGQLRAKLLSDGRTLVIDERDLQNFQRRPRGRPPRISDEKWARILHAIVDLEEPVGDVANRERINIATIHRRLAELEDQEPPKPRNPVRIIEDGRDSLERSLERAS